MINLGNKVIVSDPCYKLGTWCQGVINNVKPGIWSYECRHERSEGRVAELIVRHQDHPDAEPTKLMGFEVGVDSGTAGIFDYDYYYEHHYPKLDEDWYHSNVCDQIYDREYITDGKGVWSESGWGDGSYECYVSIFNKEIVAIKIVFINFDIDDEEEEW